MKSKMLIREEPYLGRIRRLIEEQYRHHPTGCGGSFGELLCYEIHVGNLTFCKLAEKWGINLSTLGELIWDHCRRLQEEPVVKFDPTDAESADREARADVVAEGMLETMKSIESIEGCRRSELTNKYSRHCVVCNLIAIHDTNSSGMCPDCAADKRWMNKGQK